MSKFSSANLAMKLAKSDYEEFFSGACDQYIKASRSKAREIENRLSPYSKIVIFLRPKEK